MLRQSTGVFKHIYRNQHTAPAGCLFTPFLKKKHLVVNHPLDTDLDKYYWTLEHVVTPACTEIAPTPEYKERIKQNILYNTPAFNDCWNYGVELTYKKLAPASEQTEENLLLMRILRLGMDITFAMSAVLDDIADVSTVRKNKPAWYTFCKGGIYAGMYDGMVLGYLPFFLVDKFLKGHEGYGIMMNALAQANLKMIVGEIMDLEGHSSKDLSFSHYRNINGFKAGHFVAAQPILGMALAGVHDEILMRKMYDIFYTLGGLIQDWDDFNDYYSTPEQTMKPACDFKNAGCTWVSATALEHFTPEQTRVFMENYGSDDPEKMSKVRTLYDEIDIPGKYIAHMANKYKEMIPVIEDLEHEKLQEISFSMLDWFIGGVAPEERRSQFVANN